MELISRLRNEKFDLGISEAFSFCGFGVFDKIGLQKHLSAFNTQLIESMTEPYGINYNPSHVPGEHFNFWALNEEAYLFAK